MAEDQALARVNIGWFRVAQFVLLMVILLAVVGLARAESAYHALVLPAGNTSAAAVPAAYKKLPQFNSIAAALAAAPHSGRYRIALLAGDYYEKVTIERDQVTLVGLATAGKPARIYYDAYAALAGRYHRDGWGTPGSATVTINARHTRLRNLHIANTFDYIANDALPSDHPERIRHSQAVALLLDVDSDLSYISQSRIDGYQDTVFVAGGRSYFYDSNISGTVDFIFGNALALFDHCEILTRGRGKSFSAGQMQSHISAPSTHIQQPFGLVFLHSRLTREPDVPDHSTSLGRPWHPTTTFSDGRYADPDAIGSAVYVDTWMDRHISADGWASMSGTARDGGKPRVFTPAESRFFERASTGPGAVSNPHRNSLSEADYQLLLQTQNELRHQLQLEQAAK